MLPSIDFSSYEMNSLGVEFKFEDRSKMLYPSQSKTLYEEHPAGDFDGQIIELIVEFSIHEKSIDKSEDYDHVKQVIKTKKLYSGILGFDLI